MSRFRLSGLRVVVGSCVAAAAVCALALPASAAVPTTPTPPAGKSAPGQDLKDYPKQPASHVRPQTAPAHGSSVYAVTRLANGNYAGVVYDPAPGVTSAQLYQRLQAHGVKGLLDPSTTARPNLVSPNDANACTWGTAGTIECPPLHWANNGYGHPQVYFVDHTASQWPVTLSAYEWNIAQGIDSTYVWANCPGYSGIHCVNLYDANYGGTGWAGITYYSWDGNRNLIDGSVYIQFNDYYSYNAAGYRQDTCHEMGHALGLAHNSSTGSCLYYQILNSDSARYPNGDDFSMLANLYSVSH